jgi:hypothetical protein
MRARLTVNQTLAARAAALAAAAVARLSALARNFTLLGRIHRGESTLRTSTLGHCFSPLLFVPAQRPKQPLGSQC